MALTVASRFGQTCHFSSVGTLKSFPISHGGYIAVRDTSYDEKSRGLKSAARCLETGNALELAPEELVGDFVMEHDFLAFDLGAKFLGAAVGCGLFEFDVLRMGVIAQDVCR